MRTATGIAADLGWLHDEFAADGIAVASVQEPLLAGAPTGESDALRAEFREGGSIPALWNRSRGGTSRLVGLTWVEERQVVLTRVGAGIRHAGDLGGVRFGVPRREGLGVDFRRAMALCGATAALGIAGLGLSDVRIVDIETTPSPTLDRAGPWAAELTALHRGEVDAVYLKGAVAVAVAQRHGAAVAVDLDRFPDRRVRVNNGTPRPITVDQRLLDERPDLVARFLAVLLGAADWALDHDQAAGASDLHPTLSPERLQLLARQSELLRTHGFLREPVDLVTWTDPAPLGAARDIVTARREHLVFERGAFERGVFERGVFGRHALAGSRP
jgi:ABC-type nitrate/sulfonate/bicarbonate transport system substrate-binding protein